MAAHVRPTPPPAPTKITTPIFDSSRGRENAFFKPATTATATTNGGGGRQASNELFGGPSNSTNAGARKDADTNAPPPTSIIDVGAMDTAEQ
jgi:hypothetical protein